MKRHYSHGKLLLTGEYVVLDGALSLAIPTRFGQDLKVEMNASDKLFWTSLNENGQVWFEADFHLGDNGMECKKETNKAVSERLMQILNAAKTLNPEFLKNGCIVSTHLEFPKNWGLGTSSTLINNIAKWANVNPYQLLELTFGGSGYDIASAQAKSPITYQININSVYKQENVQNKRDITVVGFNPSYKDHLYFVHLNQKQNSRDGISQYRANTSNLSKEIEQINEITNAIIECQSLNDFRSLLDLHEGIISKIISQQPIKEVLFKDFEGSVKSLGAWGGDFALVASKTNPVSYFKSKGYSTILRYDQMIYK